MSSSTIPAATPPPPPPGAAAITVFSRPISQLKTAAYTRLARASADARAAAGERPHSRSTPCAVKIREQTARRSSSSLTCQSSAAAASDGRDAAVTDAAVSVSAAFPIWKRTSPRWSTPARSSVRPRSSAASMPTASAARAVARHAATECAVMPPSSSDASSPNVGLRCIGVLVGEVRPDPSVAAPAALVAAYARPAGVASADAGVNPTLLLPLPPAGGCAGETAAPSAGVSAGERR